MRWIIATRNPDKFREIKSILSPYLKDLVFFGDLAPNFKIEENFLTLKENALKKALEVHKNLGFSTIAEDTGLFVDGLDGAPGVFSARFAGESATYEDNRKKLLELLEGSPYPERRAYFLSVAVAIISEKEIFISRGMAQGFITREERGNGGFGYDPIFLYPPLGRTFAEIGAETKNRISHRYKAFKDLLSLILRKQ